jgi:translation initiation factor 1
MAVTPPRPGSNSRLVYSTDGGRVTPEAAPPVARTRQGGSGAGRSPAPAPPDDGIVRIARDSRRRRGKTVTTITGLPGADADLDAMLKTLKQFCGAGGSREGRVLEIQGDHRERLLERLTALGHRAKLAGG